jgi:hypothetical protein
MAGSWTADRFPEFEPEIRRLAAQHQELEDEPLHLAISYQPGTRVQQDIYLFEVIGGIGAGTNPDRDLFEVVFEATPEFPMAPRERLHLILTTPEEMEVALRDGWPLAAEVVGAIRAGDYKELHADETGQRALARLQEEARRREAVRG